MVAPQRRSRWPRRYNRAGWTGCNAESVSPVTPPVSPRRDQPPTDAAAISGPHQAISASSAREKFAAKLFDALWDRYRQRVAWVQSYEKVIRQAGGTFVNDHIAFRTFATQRP